MDDQMNQPAPEEETNPGDGADTGAGMGNAEEGTIPATGGDEGATA